MGAVRLMRTLPILLVACAGVLGTSTRTQAAPRSPDWAAIQLNRTRFRLDFGWSVPPKFPPRTTVEIEVHIEPKCFAKPIGGRDEDPMFLGANNLTRNGLRIYKDVWNYWHPIKDELAKAVDERCGLNWAQEWGVAWRNPKFVDETEGNFAVGIRNADALVAGVSYYFEYDLDLDLDTRADCRFGYVTVRMQYFEDTCVFPLGMSRTDCPYLIGFAGCSWWVPTSFFEIPAFVRGLQIWQARVCGPTEQVDFRPSWNQGTDLTERFGTVCVDKDQDALCAVQHKDANVMVPLRMFGSGIGDCNDNTQLVGKENYASATGACDCGTDPLCRSSSGTVGAESAGASGGGGFGDSGGAISSGGRGSGATSGIGGGTTTNASNAGGGGLGGAGGAGGGQSGSGGTTIRRCGNGVVESGEQCDGLALDGKTCAGLLPGSDGQVNCKGDCTVDTSLCKATPDGCDGIDAPANGVIDDNDLCWRPVYRFWDESRLLDARPRCYGNSPTPPVYCAGYTREYNVASGVIYGPVFYLYDTEIAGTVALIAFDNAQSHILTRSDQHDDLVILRDATFSYIERGTIGYIWNPAQSGPSGNFYAPKDAATRLVRDLRRYSLPSAGIQLYANNPEETAPAWQFDGLTGYVWGSRW